MSYDILNNMIAMSLQRRSSYELSSHTAVSYDAKEFWALAQERWSGAFEMRRCRHGNFEDNCKDCRVVGLLRKGK